MATVSMSMSPAAPTAYPPNEHAVSPMSAVERHDFGAQKNRKYSSTGGGRAWTEQEEVYLLQTRLQKMPYKHIAAHLKKTELACRLHYHQLSHGTNRRKRATSISSCSSGQSPMTPEQRMSPDVEVATAFATPDRSPIEGSVKLWNIREDVAHSPSDSPQMAQKPLLPKPISAYPRHARAINKVLRLDCRTNIGRTRPMINRERLRQVYEAHRVSFWKMIAADYGEGADPAMLEEIWRDGGVQGSATPQSSMASLSSMTPESAVEDMRLGAEVIRRLAPSALPPLGPSDRERAFSPINRMGSSALSYGTNARTLPAPHSHSSPPSAKPGNGSDMRATAISNLLTENIETRRSLKLNTNAVGDRDEPMKDVASSA
ncbi:MAG: hypothetical protein M1838_000165 [Thelocarpon superellum]|nr:MAG: hypothetical protein M1838_000165 [Thelocarpon superellum]